MKTSLANAALRIIGLGARFLLAIFMARFMTLDDIGTFALMAGAAGLAPPLAGLGLNYFMARQLVGLPHHAAVGLVRERLRVTACAALLCSAGLLGLSASGVLRLQFPIGLGVAILVLELAAFDIHLALLARSKSNLANLLLFLRSGAWVLPFMALAWVLPAWRTMEMLAWFWLAGLCAGHGVLLLIHRSDYALALRQRIPKGSAFLSSVRWKAARIYISDIGLAGSVYLDRLLIGSLQSVEAAGIYFFYFSIVNAAYVVCLSATVQVYQPQLRAAYQQGGLRQLKVALRPRFRATALAGFGALLATLPVTWAAAHFSGKAAIIAAFPIVPLLIAAYAIKLLSDFMSVALAAAEQDGHYASFNILGLALSAGGCLLAVPLFGLAGAALAALATSGILVALRFLSWRRLEARLPVQEVLA